MYRRREIIICLGSSCFSRGNKDLLKLIQSYINQHGLTEKVQFKGDHCFENCIDGPNLMVGGKLYHQINESNIHSFLTEALHDLMKKED